MQDPHPPSQTNPIGSDRDLGYYARLVWAKRWLVLVVGVLVGSAVGTFLYMQPKVYKAACTIEYNPNPVSPLGREVEDVANPLGSFFASREFFATQNRILASRSVARRAARSLGLDHDPDFFGIPLEARDGWTSRPIDEAAARLQSMLTVEPVQDTRLVNVQVTAGDPDRAATLANAVAEAYIEKTLEDRLGSTVRALEWLGEQLGTLQSELEESELALHRFKQEHNILSVSLEDRQNLIASEIDAFNTALTSARTRRITLNARLGRLRGADIDDPGVTDDSGRGTSLRQMRERLLTKRGELERQRLNRGEGHPEVQALRSEVEQLTEQLSRELASLREAASRDLREVRQIEGGLRRELDAAQEAGLALNLREIEYQRLERQRLNKAKLYEVVLERTTETNLTRMLRETHVRMVDPALVPAAPVSPKLTTAVAAGAGSGLALGLLVAFGLAWLDRRLRSPEDIESLGVQVLGVVPSVTDISDGESTDLIVHHQPMSSAAEHVRTIRTNLMFLGVDNPLHTLLVTSASPREGKTTVAVSIAISFASSGQKTLLIDTDMRRPRLHGTFGIRKPKGIANVLLGDASLSEAIAATDVENLDLLPCGPVPPNPSELLHGAAFSRLLADVKERYDRVIFDSPPIIAVTDAAVLAPQLQGTMMVVKSNSTTRDRLRASLRQLRDVKSPILGVVLNDVDIHRARYGGYYHYYRRDAYYYAADEEHETHDEAAE